MVHIALRGLPDSVFGPVKLHLSLNRPEKFEALVAGLHNFIDKKNGCTITASQA